MKSKRIFTILVLFALLIATTSVAFASGDINDIDDGSAIEVDDDSYLIDDIDDDDLDDSDDFDDDLEDDEDWEDWDDDDWDDDEDWEDWDEDDWDDDEDWEDWDDEDWDDDEDLDDDEWYEYEEWDEEFEDGMYVHIYKTTCYNAQGVKYMASSCYYDKAGGKDSSNDAEDENSSPDDKKPIACSHGLPDAAPESADYQNKASALKSITSSDVNVADNDDTNATSMKSNENPTDTITFDGDLGLLGLLFALILSVLLII